ncbi:uncharacterized protein LOC135201724 [Macrobrachium nipponense]|uniref:uncharacterized protein LOC135201724 n=1 Tax=Macrobrachium nipponense TaxID=159736 RepID=UPI0030C7CD6A
MLCRVDARAIKALLLALVALAAMVTPATSQIHWNRGWGAGGSMGKRSSAMPSSASSVSSVDGELVLSTDCSSTDLAHLTSLIARIVESEVNRLASCALREHQVASAPESEHLSHLPWWIQARKAASTDQ